MKRILLITTIYRVGEKIYPIIEGLSKEFEIDILHMFQMSPDTKLPKEGDYRGLFQSKYSSYIHNQYYGPCFARVGGIDGVRSRDFLKSFENVVKNNNYSLVIWDNNQPTKGGAIRQFYQMFSKYGIKIIASPHANRDYKRQKLSKRIGTKYDYSFVFGEKERTKLSKIKKKALFSEEEIYERLLPAGIPSNDALKNYEKLGKYILIIPNFTEPQSKKSISGKSKPFTEEVFLKLKILELSDKFGCPIVIKEKPRAFYREHRFRDALSKYNNIEFLYYCEDDNKLMAEAKIVIGSPSTFMLKPIQAGIPTVILNGQGEIGNFKDYPGLVEPSYENILRSVKLQMKNGRFNDYINRTLSGGLNFNSTQLYIDYINKILNGET